jgi:hypothetical protein
MPGRSHIGERSQSRPYRGIIFMDTTVLNQNNEVVVTVPRQVCTGRALRTEIMQGCSAVTKDKPAP